MRKFASHATTKKKTSLSGRMSRKSGLAELASLAFEDEAGRAADEKQEEVVELPPASSLSLAPSMPERSQSDFTSFGTKHPHLAEAVAKHGGEGGSEGGSEAAIKSSVTTIFDAVAMAAGEMKAAVSAEERSGTGSSSRSGRERGAMVTALCHENEYLWRVIRSKDEMIGRLRREMAHKDRVIDAMEKREAKKREEGKQQDEEEEEEEEEECVVVQSVRDGRQWMAANYLDLKSAKEMRHRDDTQLFVASLGKVVIKRVAKSKSKSKSKASEQESARNEVELMKRLMLATGKKRLNVMVAVAMAEDKLAYWMAMPFCAQGDLHSLIALSPRLPLADIRSFARQMASALHTLHSQCGFAHLDVTPDNFLLRSKSHLLLSDFGAARPLPEQEEDGCFAAPAALARPGKSSFQSPEIFSCLRFGGQESDIWSLAVCWLALVTCRTQLWRWPDQSKDKHFALLHSTGSIAHTLRRSALGRNLDYCSRPFCQLIDAMLLLNAADRPKLDYIVAHAWLAGHDQEEPEEAAIDIADDDESIVSLSAGSRHSSPSASAHSLHGLDSDSDSQSQPDGAEHAAARFDGAMDAERTSAIPIEALEHFHKMQSLVSTAPPHS